jgi:hypothetical protein
MIYGYSNYDAVRKHNGESLVIRNITAGDFTQKITDRHFDVLAVTKRPQETQE